MNIQIKKLAFECTPEELSLVKRCMDFTIECLDSDGEEGDAATEAIGEIWQEHFGDYKNGGLPDDEILKNLQFVRSEMDIS